MANKIIGKVALTPKGDWNAIDSFDRLDVVMDNGTMYVAIQDVPANTPTSNTSYWFKSVVSGGTNPDTAMSDTSTNAVENKVIKAYVDNEVSSKVDKVEGKGLSTYDFTKTYRDRVNNTRTAVGYENKTLTTTAQNCFDAINELDEEIGSATLTTTAQTLSGAINEHETNVRTLDSDVGSLKNKVGTDTLDTTAKTLCSAVNELYNELFYSDGDTLSSNVMWVGGTISGGGKSVYFSIPLKKRLDNINSIDVTSCVAGVRTVEGKYLNDSSGSYEWVGQENISVIVHKITRGTNTIVIRITTSGTFTNAPTNNTPLGIEVRVGLTFHSAEGRTIDDSTKK